MRTQTALHDNAELLYKLLNFSLWRDKYLR